MFSPTTTMENRTDIEYISIYDKPKVVRADRPEVNTQMNKKQNEQEYLQ